METTGLIYDNFFENPDDVRLHGLAQRTYEPADFYTPGIFSGYRSGINDDDLGKYIYSKIESIFNRKVTELNLAFHLNTTSSVCGCPHHDLMEGHNSDKAFAGVIYLSPDPPANTGTTIYTKMKHEAEEYGHKMQVVYDIALPPNNIIKQRFAEEMRNYKKTLEVAQKCENVYNRMIIYPAVVYHSPEEYFGTNLDNGRLTISIHGSFE